MAYKNDLRNKKYGKLTVLEYDIELSAEKKKTYWKCECECGNIKSMRADYFTKKENPTCGECRNDLSGQIFGRLVPICKTNTDKAGHQRWLCQCQCGNTTEVLATNLIRGLTTSCGCYHKEMTSNRLINLFGQKFGKLTVIERANSIGERVEWLCRCDCGTEVIVQGANLKNGHTQSCGCLTSLGEAKIRTILTDSDFSFSTQYTFSDLPNRRFDFALFKNNYLIGLIEYQGKQHYQYVNTWHQTEEEWYKAIERDKEKVEYCKENNIPLLVIPYTDYDKLDINYIINGFEGLNNETKTV